MSYHNGVARYFLIDGHARGLDFHATKDEHEMLDHLIRVLMVRDDSDAAKARIRTAVEDALKHMDEEAPGHGPPECETCVGYGSIDDDECRDCRGSGEAS